MQGGKKRERGEEERGAREARRAERERAQRGAKEGAEGGGGKADGMERAREVGVGVGESGEEGTVRGERRVGRREREQKRQRILNTK